MNVEIEWSNCVESLTDALAAATLASAVNQAFTGGDGLVTLLKAILPDSPESPDRHKLSRDS